MNILKINHNNHGFFSCCSVRLEEIVNYFNQKSCLPDIVDSSSQFSFYKTIPSDETFSDELINEIKKTKENSLYIGQDKFLKSTIEQDEDVSNVFFKEDKLVNIVNKTWFSNNNQYTNYKSLNIKDLKPFVDRYFNVSEEVSEIINYLEKKYNINYDKLISVFYRNNDKSREVKIGTYLEFLDKIEETMKLNLDKKVLIQTDDKNFLDYCFENCSDKSRLFYLEELPSIPNNEKIPLHHVIDISKRKQFGVFFLAATKIVSKANILITHTGNCGLWSVLFRGNNSNIIQYYNNWI